MNTAVQPSPRRGFTLIEIMVVVAIMGLVMAMGVPSMLASFKKQGMRKAINDLDDVFWQARSQAVMQNRTVAVTYHASDRSFGTDSGGEGSVAGKVSSSILPEGVELKMLFINLKDFTDSDPAWVYFYPDGTSDEMTIVLRCEDDFKKITLEYSTGIPVLSDVDQ